MGTSLESLTPHDRRAEFVLPTGRGHEVIAIAQGLVPELEARVAQLVGKDRVHALREDLDTIQQSLASKPSAGK